MDEQRFDAALRALQAGTTRRRGLAGMLGVLLGGAGLGDAVAGKRRAGGKPGMAGPCGDGSGPANRCEQHRECCTRFCSRERDGVGRCRCKSRGDECEEDRNCCGSLTCQGGSCDRPVKEKTCRPGKCPGCCTGNDTCVAGNSLQACGRGGNLCQRCFSDQCCMGGKCVNKVMQQAATFGSGPGDGDGQFSGPSKIALTGNRRTALISDGGNSRVDVWARPDASGEAWSFQTSFGSEAGPAKLSYAMSVAVTQDGATAFVGNLDANFNMRISIWTNSGGVWSPQADIGGLNGPAGIRINEAADRLWVVQTGNHCVTWFTGSGSSWVQGGSFGSSGSGDGDFSYPSDLAVSSDGKTVFVADTRNNRIMVWADSGGDTWEPVAKIEDQPGSEAELVKPKGISLVEDGDTSYLNVTDEKNSVWIGMVQGIYWSYVGRFAGPEWLNAPNGILVSGPEPEALIVDSGNNRVSAWKPGCPA